ncbi:uncharacterized protein LOC114531490, partial [Dendronephthya gigantea]|uniref:uncharacterized protein LOC114531490 n=1 Tax=Dendronephthya gigantea TaxID=151771 RepID=UPI00106DA87A
YSLRLHEEILRRLKKFFRKNVLTRYKAIDHSEGRSIPETYYVKTCSKTCKIRFGICWKKKTVCHNQLRTRHKTIYETVKKYHPIYYCRYGWKQKGSECSIPECSGCNGKGSCSAPWKCTCNPGWRGSECESDFNECLRVETNKCEYRPGCNNTRGSFRCTCPDGYRLDNDLRSCNDIDECGTNSHSCSANGFCHNIRGSYRCSCKNGYQLGSDQKTCQDIDECKTYQNDCDYKAGCQNTVGSFKCTCQAGYYLDADGKTCKDVNECDGGNCQQNCVNYPGGYTCSCYSGYRRNTTNVKHCDDIDECFEKKAGCSQICTNTAGGFNCSCHPGYYFAWDEKHCNDIDECSSGRHGCDQICKNALGSYKCGCREGFELSQDGKTCIGKPCLLIYAPVNGNMNCTGHTTEHTCDFTCSTGYKHIGSRIRRCSPSRRWTGKEAKCEPIICPDPPEPSDGFVYSPCDTRFNSECIAGCDDGFHINETSKLRCTVNGRWEPNGVTCKKKKVCEPNPCRHGGECTDINSGHFSCNCSKTGYKGEKCEIGFVTIPDYPVIVADGTATTVKFRVSPPDNEILFTPQSSGVEFNPPYLLFKRNSATSQSVAITSRRPGLHLVRYHLSGSSSASFQIPQQNALTVQASSNSGSDSSAYDNITFPTGCYKLERHQCPRSEVRITALSTKPWGRIFGILATTKGLVSLSNGVIEVPFSTTGDKFRLRNPSSVNNNCGSSPAKKYSLVEMIKRRVLTKSFLNVVRDSFPKWLDLKLRRKLPFRSIVEDDLKTHYLSGKRLVKKVQLTGQPLTDDSLFSLLISPDLDLMVDGDHVSLGFPDREASFSVALELCGTPPYNVVLKPSTNLVDVINQLSVFKQMQANGWSFKIFSMQISKSSSTKRGLTLVTKFSKDFEVSNSIKSRVDFKGTLILNVHDLENIMDFPLDQKWLAKLDGEIILSMEFKVQGEMTNLAIKMPQTLSYATIGGKSKNDCFLGKKENSQGLLMQNVLKENPFLHTELGRFVELDKPSNMSCFLSAILYHEKISNNSRYRESSNGVKMTFHGNLKFGALRFDNLEVELRFENILCQNSTHQTRSKIIAELNGKYGQRVGNLQKNLGIFKITRDSVIDLHIGRETGADSGGSFSGIVNVLGFQDATKVSISQNGLNFFAKGKINGLFYASATFKSNLMPWNRQRFTTTGVFDIRETDDNLNRLLEKEIAKYTDELLTKMKGRFNLSVETESRAKARLMKVQVLREEARAKMNQINVEYRKSSEKLNVARENFNLLVEFIDGYSDEIRQLNQELSTLCAVKDCPKICHEGEHCGTRFKHTYIAVKGRCLETCHLSKQERKEPLHTDAICKNVYCKRIHSKSNLIGAPFVAFGVSIGNPAVVATGVLLLAPWSKRAMEMQCF